MNEIVFFFFASRHRTDCIKPNKSKAKNGSCKFVIEDVSLSSEITGQFLISLKGFLGVFRYEHKAEKGFETFPFLFLIYL